MHGPGFEPEMIEVSKLVLDPTVQSRVEMDKDVIKEYAAKMRRGVSFPSVVVFYDGMVYRVGGGFHRVLAALEAGIERLPADIRMGDREMAILFSVGANDEHGLRRTNADKRKSVLMALDLPCFKLKHPSSREIAKATKVSDRFVESIRREFVNKNDSYSGARECSNGSTYTPTSQRFVPPPIETVPVATPTVDPEPNEEEDLDLVAEPIEHAVPEPELPKQKKCPCCHGSGYVEDTEETP